METMIEGLVLSERQVLRVRRAKRPLVKGEVRLDLSRAAFCGCGRETVVYKGFRAPARHDVIAGHQMMGIVAESRSERHRQGDRVAVYPYVGCGECDPCHSGNASLCQRSLQRVGSEIDGGWSTGLVLPATACIAAPDAVSDEMVALSGCSLSTAYSALRRIGIRRGEHLLAYNAGSLGLSAIAIAVELGAHVTVVEPNPVRQRISLELGAREVIDEHAPDLHDRLAASSASRPFDLAFDPTNDDESRRRCLYSLRPGGRLVMVGEWNGMTATDTATIIAKGLTLTGSWAFSMNEQREVLGLLAHGFEARARALQTHTFALADADQGFTLYDSLTTGIICIDCTSA